MALVFSADAVDLSGAAVLGYARSDGSTAAWHDGVSYAGFRAIKDLQPDRGDLVILAEGGTGTRYVCRLVEGRHIAGCTLFRTLNRPLCLLVHDGALLIGHVGGIASVAVEDLHRASPAPIRSVDGRVVSLVAFRGRLLAAVQPTDQPYTQVIDVETGEMAWSDDRNRFFSKLIVWQDRLAATDADSAEVVFLDREPPGPIPLRHGYLRALRVLADGSLLVARNRWRLNLRRHGLRMIQRLPLPQWWEGANFTEQRGSDLVVVDGSGRITREIPFAHLAGEVSGAVETAADCTGDPGEAAHLRAIHQRESHDQLLLSLSACNRRLKKMPAQEQDAGS